MKYSVLILCLFLVYCSIKRRWIVLVRSYIDIKIFLVELLLFSWRNTWKTTLHGNRRFQSYNNILAFPLTQMCFSCVPCSFFSRALLQPPLSVSFNFFPQYGFCSLCYAALHHQAGSLWIWGNIISAATYTSSIYYAICPTGHHNTNWWVMNFY